MSRRETRGGNLPLIAWGEEMRRRKVERRCLRLRAVLVTGFVGVVAVSAWWHPAPRLVWNASASAPIGLYLVSPGADVRRGDIVIARVATKVRALAAKRRYIPANIPLVKHVGAVAGNTVCAIGTAITIDGRAVAIRRTKDGLGRPMPRWIGCRLLRQGEIFLLNAAVSDSFDGRYFGVSPTADIFGSARPIWMR